MLTLRPVRPLRRGARGHEPAEGRDPGRPLGLRAGLRAAATGRTPTSRSVYLARVKKAAETSKATFRVHSAKNLLGIVAGILEGEIQRDGRRSGAAPSRRSSSAVALEDALTYDEPEPLPFAARHWLGAALLEAKRFDDAETRLSRGARGPPAQRLVAARPAAGARRPGHDVEGGGRRSGRELVARGHLDSVVAVLTTLHESTAEMR